MTTNELISGYLNAIATCKRNAAKYPDQCDGWLASARVYENLLSNMGG